MGLAWDGAWDVSGAGGALHVLCGGARVFPLIHQILHLYHNGGEDFLDQGILGYYMDCVGASYDGTEPIRANDMRNVYKAIIAL